MLSSHHSLFSTFHLAGKPARNRFAAQPMEINAAGPSGGVSERVRERYRVLARGDWGLVFLEAVSLGPDCVARRHGLVLGKKTLRGFRALVELFKTENPHSLFIVQLTHAGRLCLDESRRVKVYGDESGIRQLEEKEIEELRDRFVGAAHYASEAGADGVDIKACHGYLGGEFLRPRNTRRDGWGGSPENRARLLLSVISAVRKECPGLAVGTRVSLYEGVPGGCGTAGADDAVENLEDMMSMLDLVRKAGAHYLNISAGIPSVTPLLTRPARDNAFEAYHHFRYARAVKERLAGPAVIGSAYSALQREGPPWAGGNVSRGHVDFAGFGRQSLADPLLPLKLRDSPGDIHYCTLCGGCSRLLAAQKAVRCTVYGGKE
jgi:2,4-dienoyl-CoA reductase-like NADH-dependent reductase (Old Yellow Enzyme family)